MTKANEHDAAHSLGEAITDAQRRAEWKRANRPDPRLTFSSQEKAVLTVIAVLGVLFVSGVGWIGCVLSKVCS